jgi:ATP phosphoribosyltransferase
MSFTLAIPSKGRLKDQTDAWLSRHGLILRQTGGERGYAGLIDGAPEVVVRLASAGDIARLLVTGEAQAGITGEDILRESTPDQDAGCALPWTIHARLGFGRADVVVAVPSAWIDVRDMADLAEVAGDLRRATGRRFRVATKFHRLAAAWFAEHGVRDHRIIDSAGATEGAPGSGLAEAIVDITSTGATLQANGLRILDDGLILKSEACLIASHTAAWTDEARAALARFLERLGA